MPALASTTLVLMTEQPRFCGRCGVSLVPLDVPHVERPCDECGETRFLAEPGEDGAGIKVEKGDRFTIPAGWLTISLDPSASRGRLTKAGTLWFVSHMLTGDLPGDGDGLRGYLQQVEDDVDGLLRSSEVLAHLNLDDEADADKAFELLKENSGTVEWSALLVDVLRGKVDEALDNGVDALAILRALQMQAHRGLMMYKRHLAEFVWTGYEQISAVYNIAAAAARTPVEEKKIRALEPVFKKLDEAALHAWVDAEVSIGERLEVTDVDEDVLLGLARYHLALREREREQGRWEADRLIRLGEYRVKLWQLLLAVGGFGLVAGRALAEIV